MAKFFIDTHFVFNPSDYPNLFWLLSILQPGQTLLDFGGGVGQCYYLYQRLLRYPEQMRWLVVRWRPSSNPAGNWRSKTRQRDLPSRPISQMRTKPRFFLPMGACNHRNGSLPVAGRARDAAPAYLDQSRSSLRRGTVLHVQKSQHSYVPYKVMNLAAFICGMEELGYEKVDQWYLFRFLRIPFHPRNFVTHYWGFYFRLR